MECYTGITRGSTLDSTLGSRRKLSSLAATKGNQVEIVNTEEVKLEAEKTDEEMGKEIRLIGTTCTRVIL